MPELLFRGLLQQGCTIGKQVNITLAGATAHKDILHTGSWLHGRDSLHAADERSLAGLEGGKSQHAQPAEPVLPAAGSYAPCSSRSSAAFNSRLQCTKPSLQPLGPVIPAMCMPDDEASHLHAHAPIIGHGSQPDVLWALAILCAAQAALILFLLVRSCSTAGAVGKATAGEGLHETAAPELTPEHTPLRATPSSGSTLIGSVCLHNWCMPPNTDKSTYASTCSTPWSEC